MAMRRRWPRFFLRKRKGKWEVHLLLTSTHRPGRSSLQLKVPYYEWALAYTNVVDAKAPKH